MKRRNLILLAVVLALFLIASCFPVRAIKLNIQTGALEIIVGETKNIALTVDPVDSSVSFTTADDSIATVSPLGVVTGVAVGNTTVAIEATKDGYKKAQGSVTITVVPVPEYTVTFEVSDLEGPVNGANVAFNSETKLTDENGLAVFSGVLRGNRQYTVSKIGYEDATEIVNVDSDKTVDVTLSNKLYTLSIEVTGEGTVTKNPDKPEYTHGEEVQLTALPDEGWSFGDWTGDLTGSDNPKAVVMDQNRSVSASFTINTYTIVATAGPGGAIEPEGQIQVNRGDDKEFIITPDAGYEIADVIVDGVSVGAVANYTFNNVVSHHTIDASFSLLEYTITVSASPAEGGSVSGGGVYKHGETVDLTAVEDDSYRFKNWTESGVVVSTDPNYSFTASTSRDLVANFIEKTYELTVNISGQGSVDKQPDKALYMPGEVVNLTAIPETGWRFLNWSGSLTGNTSPASITMNNDKTVSANFAINQYVVVVSPNPQNGGVVSGGGTYPHGETVTLNATPNEGYEFLNWTDGGVVVSTEAEYLFNATADRLLTANFALKSYTLETQVSGEGAVQRTPDKAHYTHGEIVELTAVPDNGWGFVGWSGDLEVSENPAEINMDSDKSVTATFTRNQYTVNLVAEPQEGGTVAGGGVYSFGDEATITSQASDCYLFTGWYEDGLLVSESAEYSFTVDGDRELEARFVKAVISKEFVFILENFFLGCKYDVTLELDPQITRVRFIYPDIDPEEQTPIPEEAFPDEEGKVEITAFWTNKDATAVVILCYIGDELVSQCLAELSK
ncbi:hypothetical protein BG32_13770 [Mesotoga sp. HF07.pep.5.2.highcov]|uniref:InlB B-repeat-containing protein n=1 Tax=Mesotoga sp. HF07.pep.5.2.highcov TaxID=1462923 RepID=UPI000EF14D39|nr:InlB B-repeat-containing protein [Mesotoga sp. HF07.pep.5.2.highcov]RLL91817.1 hypothetical protein BG32_13770 [Mesotoga sp. HF07.pep.5.2.highcov]